MKSFRASGFEFGCRFWGVLRFGVSVYEFSGFGIRARAVFSYRRELFLAVHVVLFPVVDDRGGGNPKALTLKPQAPVNPT